MKGLEEELERLRDNQDDVAKALPNTVQFWGLIALVLGFCLQLIAMIVKDFG